MPFFKLKKALHYTALHFDEVNDDCLLSGYSETFLMQVSKKNIFGFTISEATYIQIPYNLDFLQYEVKSILMQFHENTVTIAKRI